VYPDNTISSFKIRLVKPVDLTTGAWQVGVFEFSYTSPASGMGLQSIFLYWDLTELQLVGDMPRRYLRIVSQGPACVLQRVLHSGGKDRLSVDLDRRADKIGRRRPVSLHSETACCRP